jgi:5-methylcytosine-specific restriction endonuclease McrA
MLTCFPEDLAPWRRFNSWCSAHINTRESALYWVIHTKTHLQIFLRSDDTPEIIDAIQNKLPNGIELKRRKFPRKGIAINTPLFFFVKTEEQARNMGPLLQLLSSSEFNLRASARRSNSHYWMPGSEKNDPEFRAREEGNKVTITVSRYERDRKNRERCIQHYGPICSACGFDFSVTYGEIGTDYIHVHHLIKIASHGGKVVKIDPIADLRPVCPNCHEMIHRMDPPYTIDELKGILAKAKAAR